MVENNMSKVLKAKDVAYGVIKNKIMNNEFKSGEYLEEKKLCELVGVSRTPIREALNQLSNEDFVIIIPNKGTFVTTMDVQKAKELFQTRSYLEPIVLKIAWKNLDLAMLEEYKDSFHDSIENKDVKNLNELDYEFHNYINSCCHNEYLAGIMYRLQDQFQRVRTLNYYNHERVLGGAREHIQLINLYKEDKIDEAIELLHTHVLNTERYYYMSF